MLSILRRHVGWGIKVILGIVIVSFVFFFGYSALQKQSTDTVAIQVGREEIPLSRFRFFYDNQYEIFKSKFKDGDMPEFLLKSIQQSTERVLVQRSLLRQFAQKIGIQVSDRELAETITREKDFDPVAYKDFLKNFYRQNGFSYEEMVREDLLLEKFQTWAQTIQPPLPERIQAKEAKESKKEPPSPTPKPKTGLIDLWFEDFASKIKVQSLTNQESL